MGMLIATWRWSYLFAATITSVICSPAEIASDGAEFVSPASASLILAFGDTCIDIRRTFGACSTCGMWVAKSVRFCILDFDLENGRSAWRHTEIIWSHRVYLAVSYRLPTFAMRFGTVGRVARFACRERRVLAVRSSVPSAVTLNSHDLRLSRQLTTVGSNERPQRCSFPKGKSPACDCHQSSIAVISRGEGGYPDRPS